jgi:hypothetical protein
LDDRARLEEVLGRETQAGEAESGQDRLQLGGVFFRRFDEEIDIARRAGITVIGDGMPADDQVLHIMII